MIVFQFMSQMAQLEAEDRKKANIWKTKILLFHKYTTKQISDKLGVTVSTVRKYIEACSNIGLEEARKNLKRHES